MRNLLDLSLVVLLFVISACKKDGVPRKYASIGECHNKSTWDSTSIRAKLVGKWEWEYVRCFWNPEDNNGDAAEDNVVEFDADGTGHWADANQVKTDFTWEVIAEDNAWGIKTTPALEHVIGKVLFCEDKLELAKSYIDACDNFYERK